jgi:hypothetical protein
MVEGGGMTMFKKKKKIDPIIERWLNMPEKEFKELGERLDRMKKNFEWVLRIGKQSR